MGNQSAIIKNQYDIKEKNSCKYQKKSTDSLSKSTIQHMRKSYSSTTVSNIQGKMLEENSKSDGKSMYSNASTLSNSSERNNKDQLQSQSPPTSDLVSSFELNILRSDLNEKDLPSDLKQKNSNKESVTLNWGFGGKKVYIIIMQEEEEILKEKMQSQTNSNEVQFFEATIDLEPGQYYYYYLVDGEQRFDCFKPVFTFEDNKIMNILSIIDFGGKMKSDCQNAYCDYYCCQSSSSNSTSAQSPMQSSPSSPPLLTTSPQKTTTTKLITERRRSSPQRKDLEAAAANWEANNNWKHKKQIKAKRVHFEDCLNMQQQQTIFQ